MQYTDEVSIENYLKRNIDASFSSQVSAYIDAMSEYIDETIGYPLYRNTATTRKYDGSGSPILHIDPVHSISEVRVDSTVVTPTEYPYNKDIKRQLILEGQQFSKGIANVEVDGTFSLRTSLPPSAKHACTVLCAMILNQVDEQVEGIASEKIGDFQVSFRNQKDRSDYQMAKDIIMSFKPLSF